MTINLGLNTFLGQQEQILPQQLYLHFRPRWQHICRPWVEADRHQPLAHQI